MISPQLLQYVRAQRAAGISKEEIVKALAGGGWSAGDAQEAFAAIDAPTPPPAPAPAPVPTPVTPPPQPVARPVVQPVTPRPAPMSSPIVSPAAVVQPRPVYTPQVKKRSKWPWVLLGLLFFFIFGMGAGAYVAAMFDSLYSVMRNIAGRPIMEQAQTPPPQTEGTLEVSPTPFDTTTLPTDNSSSTPATGGATSTASTTSGQ